MNEVTPPSEHLRVVVGDLALLHYVGEAKVRELRAAVGGEQHVLGLEVAVGDAAAAMARVADSDSSGGALGVC